MVLNYIFKKKKIKNYAQLAKNMVETQLKSRDIKDEKVLEVISKIPRHLFVPESCIESAYEDHPLPIGEGQTISQPYMVALMTQLLELKENERILEIGTGSGYQAAILASLCKEVYTVERIEKLSLKAQQLLNSLGYKNIYFKINDGTIGWPEHAPYDGIIVTATARDIPQPYMDQIVEGGKIVIPVGDRFSQVLILAKKVKNQLIKKEICSCIFVPLIGKYGYND